MSEALQHEIRHLHDLEGSARDPEGRVFLPLANAYLRVGDHDRAEQLLVEGLGRHPDFVAAHVLAARLREAQGNVDGAELAWAAARRLDPENVEVLFGLGRIMAGRGEEIGVTLVERARALDPTAGRTATSPAATDADVVHITDLAPEKGQSGWDHLAVVSIADLAPDDLRGDLHDVDVAMGIAEDAPTWDGESDVVSIAELAPDSGVAPQGEFGEDPEAADETGADGDSDGDADDEATGDADEEPISPVHFTPSADFPSTDPGAELGPEAGEEFDELSQGQVGEDSEGEEEAAGHEASDDGDPDDGAMEEGSEGIMPMSELTPAPERASSGNGGRRVVTRTLAELLVMQGQHAQALEMYETLVARNPNDPDLQDRLDQLQAGAKDTAQAGSTTSEEESLHHHPSAPEPTPDKPTPFAWTEPSEGDAGPEVADGPSASAFFEGLLSWTPAPSPDEDT